MRWVLLAVLLASLAGCDSNHRYQAAATEKDVWILDTKTGQLFKPKYKFAAYGAEGGYTGRFGPRPEYPK